MKALRWILAAIWIVAFFTGRAVFDFSGTVSDLAAERRVAPAPVSIAAPTLQPRERPRGPHIDLYGTPIDKAVTDYRVDPRGELYEHHAPDTAVLKLPSAGA
jgi:hypothetical protein